MNKKELVKLVAENTEHKKKDIEAVLDKTFEVIQDALVDGDKVSLFGFGHFEVRNRAARKGRNPNDPTVEVIIPASKTVGFKPAKGLKQSVQ